MEFARATVSVASSGVARAYDFAQTDQAIADFGAEIARGEQDAAYLIARGDGLSHEQAVKQRVIPASEYGIDDLAGDDMKLAADAVTMKLGPTATVEVKVRAIDALLPQLDAAKRKAIRAELEKQENEPPPAPPRSPARSRQHPRPAGPAAGLITGRTDHAEDPQRSGDDHLQDRRAHRRVQRDGHRARARRRDPAPRAHGGRLDGRRVELGDEHRARERALKAAYRAHRVDTGAHVAADSTNTISAATATDLASTQTLLNELKTDINAHLVLEASHRGISRAWAATSRPSRPRTAPDLTTTQALANALKAILNRWAGRAHHVAERRGSD